MKRAILTAFVLVGLTLTSCGSDDNGGGAEASIVGKWNPLKTETKVGNSPAQVENYDGHEPGCDKDYFEFVQSGSLREVVYFKNVSDVCTEDEAQPSSWVKNDNTLTINDGQYDGVYQIKRLTSSDLQLSTEVSFPGGTTTTLTLFFKKAAN